MGNCLHFRKYLTVKHFHLKCSQHFTVKLWMVNYTSRFGSKQISLSLFMLQGNFQCSPSKCKYIPTDPCYSNKGGKNGKCKGSHRVYSLLNLLKSICLEGCNLVQDFTCQVQLQMLFFRSHTSGHGVMSLFLKKCFQMNNVKESGRSS